MALEVSTPKRQFIIKKKNKKENIVLPDPHPDMTIPEVVNHYKSKYPEISTAVVDGPKMEDNCAVYYLNTALGEKG